MEARQIFIEYVENNIHRKGIENLMDWLDTETDFFTTPASTRYHGSYEGGLLDHSLNVYEQLLIELDNTYGTNNWQTLFSEETVALVALFHDLCKVNTYETFIRNVKNNDTNQWEQVESYRHSNQTFEMGHGAKSMFYLQKFMEITDEEAQAIFWHMGAYDISGYMTLNGLSSAWNSNALGFLLSRSDIFVTYVSENPKFIWPEKSEVDDVENVSEADENNIATKTTYLRHDGTGDIIVFKKGDDLTSYFNGSEILNEVTKKEYEYWKAEQEALEYEKKRDKASSIRMPGKKPTKPATEEKPAKEAELKLAPKVSYYIDEATGKPIKVFKGESIEFLSEGEYTNVTVKEYKAELAVWENNQPVNEDDNAESEVDEAVESDEAEVADVTTYWYDKKTGDYFEVAAGEELPIDLLEVDKAEFDETLEDEADEEVGEESEVEESEGADDAFEEDETTAEVTTYWFDNDKEEYFIVEAGELLPTADEDVEELNEKDYLDAVRPKLEENYYFFNTEDNTYGVIKKGERIPEDFDEEIYEEITKDAYNDATKPAKADKPVVTQKARRRTPAPTRRPK